VTTRKLAYPPSLPPGRMVRNLNGASGFTLLVGDFGPDGMVIVDPAVQEGFRFVQLPARRMHFLVDRNEGGTFHVLVEDGRLLKFNALTGMAMGELAVTGPYAMDAGVLRPRLAGAGNRLVVSDPAAGEIAVVDAAAMRVIRRIKVGGQPFDVALVGGTGAGH
jgi:YVTN family beta-propeller protein